jgi:hypothetical protein
MRSCLLMISIVGATWAGSEPVITSLIWDRTFALPSPELSVWHLLLHTLGMWHTGSRWDRDDYVTIVWENIVPGREYNFRKRTHDDTLLGFPYYFD